MTHDNNLRLIATEEACAFPEQVEAIRKLASSPGGDADLVMWSRFLSPAYSTVLRRLLDLGDERIGIMDEAGIDLQVLSMTSPGVQLFDADTATAMAADTNDRLADAVRSYPSRYAALASFAPQDPGAAAKEIDRAINTLKLNGLIVNSHTRGEYLDDPKFWPIFEAAVASNASLYIHPRNPPFPASQILDGSYNLYGAIWGFHVETGIHAMRLIVNGVFDAFPDLKIVLGHLGEALAVLALSNRLHVARKAETETERVRAEQLRLHDERHESPSGFAVLPHGARRRQPHVRRRLPVSGNDGGRSIHANGTAARRGFREGRS